MTDASNVIDSRPNRDDGRGKTKEESQFGGFLLLRCVYECGLLAAARFLVGLSDSHSDVSDVCMENRVV